MALTRTIRRRLPGDDRALVVKRAFADAVEWRIVRRLTDVAISDGTRTYSIPEFAAGTAQQEIAEKSRLAGSISALLKWDGRTES